MKTLALLLIKGLSAILPVTVVLFFIYWIGAIAEHALGGLLKAVLPAGIYLPGMGLLAGLILAICAGLLLNLWLFRRLVELLESWLARLPLVNTIMGGIKDMMALLASGSKRSAGKKYVVRVDMGNDMRLIGIMTREDLDGKASEAMGEGLCAVYLPMSYQMGGYTLYLPRSKLTPVDMTVEDALRFAMTAGVSVKASSGVPPAGPRQTLS